METEDSQLTLKNMNISSGRVTGRDANRSKKIRDILESIGIDDTPAGRKVLEEIFQKGLTSPEGWRKTNPYGVTD